jgi:hypothetical protein
VVGASIVVKNNKERLVVDASKVWRAATLAEALAHFVASTSLTPEQLIDCFGLQVDVVTTPPYEPATMESVGVLLPHQRCISVTGPCIIAELATADDSSGNTDAAEDVVTHGMHLLRYKCCVNRLSASIGSKAHRRVTVDVLYELARRRKS